MKKMPVAFRIFLSAVLCSLIILSCQKEEHGAIIYLPTDKNAPNLPVTPFHYANLGLPAYLTTPPIAGQNTALADNPVTDYGATLGRVLFYDVNLSANNTKACASCHQQAFSFSDPDQFSLGFDGQRTPRNSMSLINAAYYPNGRYFWDERAASVEAQASRPIVNPVEMGMSMPKLVAKLKTVSYYPPLFKDAFGTTTIDSAGIVRALAQFVRSTVSYRTKYDQGRAAFPPNQAPGMLPFANYTAQENQGKQLFFGVARCAQCHGTETFTSAGPKNNGLDLVYTDNGIGTIVGNPLQNGLFKAPSLRGIALSAPYMHDGRFSTLEQVVEHYDSGVKAHPNLSPQLRDPNGMPHILHLTAQEKAALVAFLNTLTDTGIASDEKYANPF